MPLRSLWISSHGIVDLSSLLFAVGLLLLRAFDARHVGQVSFGFGDRRMLLGAFVTDGPSGGVASAILLAVVGARRGSLWMLELLLLQTWHGIESVIILCGWIERKEPYVRLWIINERDEMFAYPYSRFCGIELDFITFVCCLPY